MAVQILHLLMALQDDELRNDGDGLQVYRECPQQFDYVEALVHEHGEYCQAGHWHDPKLNVKERIMAVVVRRLERVLVSNHVHDVARGCDVEDLHDAVVQAVVGREEIEVAAHEHGQEKFLRLQ